jgi:glycine/D-amino acid oxidase-like deaminating enzyme
MALRIPQSLSTGLQPETGWSVLDHELREQKMHTLGTLSGQVERALAALRVFDAEAHEPGSEHRRRAHGMANFIESTIRVAETDGIEHEVLNADWIRQRFPQFAPVLDSALGCFEPGGGYVRPERCIEAQLTLAKRLGAELMTGTVVTGLHSDDGKAVVSTNGATIVANKAIVCAGMWNAELLGALFDHLLKVCRQNLYWFKLAEPSILTEGSPTFILTHGPTDQDVCYGFPPIPGENSTKIATEQYTDATTPDALQRQVTLEECKTMFRSHWRGFGAAAC